jgi:hypothetical protein
VSRILLVYWHPEGVAMRPAVEQHLLALERYAARGTVEYLNSCSAERPPGLQGARYDAVVLHTTFLTQRWGDTFGLFKQRFEWIADFPRRKVAIPQDEYDHPYVLDEWLYELGVDDVFTNFAEPQRSLLYPILGRRARFHECLTGYIDSQAAADAAGVIRPLRERPLDVVYRASRLPFWFGRHGQLKHRIGEAVLAAAEQRGLETDISMRYEDVIYGDDWLSFLASGKAVVGAESGSSVLDRRGEVQTTIRSLLAASPQLTFDEIDRRLPAGWDGQQLTAVSPRHFEAVITRTPQLLVEGAYSGVLERDVHYVPIKPDLSDVDAALERLADLDAMEQMADRAYEDIYASGRYTYRTFARQLADVVYAEPGRAPLAAAAVGSAARVAESAAAAGDAAARTSVVAASLALGLLRGLRSTLSGTRPTAELGGVPTPISPPPALGSAGRLRLELARSTVRLLVANRPLLRLVAPGAQRGIPPRAIARDLLRLAILAEQRRATASASTPWTCVMELRGDSLVLASYPTDAIGVQSQPLNGADFREIVWDHSAVGTAVPFSIQSPELGELALGTDGVYRFAAISELARRRPELARAALDQLERGA